MKWVCTNLHCNDLQKYPLRAAPMRAGCVAVITGAQDGRQRQPMRASTAVRADRAAEASPVVEAVTIAPSAIRNTGSAGIGEALSTHAVTCWWKECLRSEEHTSELQSLMSISYA